MVQIIIALLIIAIVGAVAFLVLRKRSKNNIDEAKRIQPTFEALNDSLLDLLEMASREDNVNTLIADYEAEIYRRHTLSQAIDDCRVGKGPAIAIVKSYIKTFIDTLLTSDEDYNDLVSFDTPEIIPSNYKWVITMFLAKKKSSRKPMEYIEEHFGLTVPKIEAPIPAKCPNLIEHLEMDDAKLDNIFMQLLYDHGPLTKNDKLDVLTQICFQKIYGYGIVDQLRHSDVDGFNFGTSGSLRYLITGELDVPYRLTNSIWVQVNAQWVHLSALDFGSENEMVRVITQLSCWGNTPPITEKSPAKVNDAYDGARITAIRKDPGECWGCFVRMFSAGLYVKEKLLCKLDADGNEILHNWQLPSEWIKWQMLSKQTTAFTGQQNTGKTSMMKAAMADIQMVNTRILEMSFELALRELYPWRNVFTVKPTPYINAAALQDILKKTDAYLSMVGEVAEDIVAARMIQFAIIASAFTLFSHHAKDDYELITGIAQSLVACGEYKDYQVALNSTLKVITSNIHLDFCRGQRVVAYISEIEKLDELTDYPSNVAVYPERKDYSTMEEYRLALLEYFVKTTAYKADLDKEFYTRTTDRARFKSHKIIVFDPETMTYKTNEHMSPEYMSRILNGLSKENRKAFKEWYKKNWNVA